MRRMVGWLALIAAGAPSIARADGAFPDEIQLFTPAAHPARLVLAANFGLLDSEDSGKTWYYICEGQAGATGIITGYQYGPTDTLLSDGPLVGVHRSADQGCSWSGSTGCFFDQESWDVAFDPGNPGPAYALSDADDAGKSSGVFASVDDGATFGCPIYRAPGYRSLSGIEFCQSEPGTLYLTGNQVSDAGPLGAPFVVMGWDGGAGWAPPIAHPELAAVLAPDGGQDGGPFNPLIRLAGVDPKDCSTAYFRLTLDQDYLAVTHDRGRTIQVIFAAPDAANPMSAFLVGGDGTLYVGLGCAPDAQVPCPKHALWAADAGSTQFQQVNSVNVRCLAERSGLLYACGNDWTDGFAIGSSTDHGKTWTHLLNFVDIQGLAACPGTDIAATCANTWCGPPESPGLGLVALFGIPDAGWPCDGGGPTTTPHPSLKGCGCSSAGGASLLLALAALSFGLRKRRRLS